MLQEIMLLNKDSIFSIDLNKDFGHVAFGNNKSYKDILNECPSKKIVAFCTIKNKNILIHCPQ